MNRWRSIDGLIFSTCLGILLWALIWAAMT